MATDVRTSSAPGQAGRGPALHHRQGPLSRRHQAHGDDPHGHPPQPVRPRQHPLGRHVGGEDDARRRSRSSSVPTSRGTRCRWPGRPAARPGSRTTSTRPRILATDSVKWTGEGVAAVVAETAAQAVDALEAIEVDYEPLPAVVDAEKATQPGAPQLHENAPNNVVFDWTVGDKDGHGRRRSRTPRSSSSSASSTTA